MVDPVMPRWAMYPVTNAKTTAMTISAVFDSVAPVKLR